MVANADLQKTPLHALHGALGAKMVGFADYDMPLHYPRGVLGEHLHTRAAAGLFDVSHMGQARLSPNGDQTAAALMEELTPGGLVTLSEGGMRYTQLTNDKGGILDDLIVTRFGSDVWLVVNAACKKRDFAHIETQLAGRATLKIQTRALIALQGPSAAQVLRATIPESADLRFMQARWVEWQGEEILLSRCGYTGEDGFEISLPPHCAENFARKLLADKAVEAVGLGARDSLRLEAALCLYGTDIDTDTTPIEANLAWSVPKRRREGGGFPGAAVLAQQLAEGPPRLRVGILPETRAPARQGTEIQTPNGEAVGTITSGGFAPSLKKPVAMGYVAAAHAALGTKLNLLVRGKTLAAEVVSLPFVVPNYVK